MGTFGGDTLQACPNHGGCPITLLGAYCVSGPFTQMVHWIHIIIRYQLIVPSLFNKTRAKQKQDLDRRMALLRAIEVELASARVA